jgi:hypothetical protein
MRPWRPRWTRAFRQDPHRPAAAPGELAHSGRGGELHVNDLARPKSSRQRSSNPSGATNPRDYLAFDPSSSVFQASMTD